MAIKFRLMCFGCDRGNNAVDELYLGTQISTVVLNVFKTLFNNLGNIFGKNLRGFFTINRRSLTELVRIGKL